MQDMGFSQWLLQINAAVTQDFFQPLH